MYRTGDPRFRRRLNELGQQLESVNEAAQSNLYIFGQTYIRPCFESIGDCFHTAVDSACPTLNLSARDRERARRQQGRRRGRAELAFDFYDDWEEEDPDPLDSWSGNEEFDRLLSSNQSYGTVQHTQPARPRGMSYPKGRRKSTLDNEPDPTLIPGSQGFIARLFGSKTKNLRYKPSAADLQEHPGARRLGRDSTEGEALLAEEGVEGSGKRRHRRNRSSTVTSGHTTDSLSSRGDIFPSDEELDDAIPLDDEFAMVLERRTTQSGPETESSSQRTRGSGEQQRRRRGKRPSAGSHKSTNSSRSRKRRSRTNSSAAQTPIDEVPPDHDFGQTEEDEVEQPTLSELKAEETRLAEVEEAEVNRRREEALRLAAERGLLEADAADGERPNETPPHAKSPILQPVIRSDEPSQLPTPLGTDDEAEVPAPTDAKQDEAEVDDPNET